MLAVCEKYLELPLIYNDVYLNIVGGMKITTRDADLSVVASLLSSYYQKPIPQDHIFLGEVGLTGEVRFVPHLEARVKELAQLNYTKIFVPMKSLKKIKSKHNLELVGIRDVHELKKFYFE